MGCNNNESSNENQVKDKYNRKFGSDNTSEGTGSREQRKLYNQGKVRHLVIEYPDLLIEATQEENKIGEEESSRMVRWSKGPL